MSGGVIARRIQTALLCVLLGACTGFVRDGDGRGDLGGDASPGDLYVKLGVEYLRLGNTETAMIKANKALEEDSGNAQAHNLMALVYQRLGQDELAEKHFRRAIDLEPEDSYVRNAYASHLCNQRKYAQAEAQYEKALENPLYPTPWVAMTNMGTCAGRRGDDAKAQAYFERALRANPSFGPALAALAQLEYDRGRYASAKTRLDGYFRVAQPTPRVLLLAVQVERKLGSRKRAATYAQMLRKNYPESQQALQL